VMVIDALKALEIPYMVVGSLSSNYYGVARSTKDADFVIQLGETPVPALVARLGSGFQLDPQLSFETITGTTRYIIRLADTPFQIEIFVSGEDPHDQERFRRRHRVQIQGREAFVPTAEDVIITKLRWSLLGQRHKDLDDARNVIAVQGDRLDWDYLYRWCDLHGTRDQLD